MLSHIWVAAVILVALWLLGKLLPAWKEASLKDKVIDIEFIKRQAKPVKDIGTIPIIFNVEEMASMEQKTL